MIPARLFGQKASGGRVEILIERLLPDNAARAAGVSKPPQVGSRIALDAGGEAEGAGRDEGGFWQLRFHVPEPLENWLLHAGRMPLPPYIQRAGADDAERLPDRVRESRRGRRPPQGLHFDEALLEALRERGVHFGHVTLHVGAGTFQPVRVDDIREHRMHSEWLNVGAELVQQVRARARPAGAWSRSAPRSCARWNRRCTPANCSPSPARPASSCSRAFASAKRRRAADQLPPAGKHAADAGVRVRRQGPHPKAYEHAVRERYRFFSYGDAMLLFPEQEK